MSRPYQNACQRLQCRICGVEDAALAVVGPDGSEVAFCFDHRRNYLGTISNLLDRLTPDQCMSSDWHNIEDCPTAEGETELEDDAVDLNAAYDLARRLGYELGGPTP